MTSGNDSHRSVEVRRVEGQGSRPGRDRVAAEEPLEIRIVFGADEAREARSLSVTMRTPGSDFELAAGFLFTEGVVRHPDDVRKIEFCGPAAPGRETSNIVRVELDPRVRVELQRVERNFYTTSSCGICGKASLDALEAPGLRPLDPSRPRVERERIHELPELLRAGQPLFELTGGLHAAGLFDPDARLIDVREDVGRHNAVDKLLGRRFLDGETPLAERILVVSGRTSFELLQKALVAGIGVAVGVGAPSSLAVELARRFDMTLIGFASRDRFNVYGGSERIVGL